jgi:cytosine/adenosine deaminase-related metal-dependent hydrolase
LSRAATLALGPDAAGRVVVIAGDGIVEVGTAPPPPGVPTLPCPGALLEPGRVNAHTHVYSALAALDMPPPEPAPRSFVEILERVWWRLDRALDEGALRASARLYAAESLLAGTTTLVDHHESPDFIEGSLDVLADACDELGIRALLCFGATERNGGRAEAARGLAECRRFLAADRRPHVRGVVGLHASFTVSDETAREAGAMARDLGTVTHVHLAEDAADVVDARRRGFPGPLRRLLRLEALPAGSILAHGVHLSVDEVREASEHGLWIVQNPRSNRGNGVGYPGALAASRRVALGTDGYPARMEEEVAVLEQEAAAHGDDLDAARRRPDAGRDLAAERFGRPFAPLAPGAAADVVAREGATARHVVVGGRIVVEGGRLAAADLDAIRAEAAEQAPRLFRRMAALRED